MKSRVVLTQTLTLVSGRRGVRADGTRTRAVETRRAVGATKGINIPRLWGISTFIK